MTEHERHFHLLVKQLLDGDITLADLPAELRAEGEEALRMLADLDLRPVAVPSVTWRVMANIERRRRRVLPWPLAPALALAAVLVLWIMPATSVLPGPRHPTGCSRPGPSGSTAGCRPKWARSGSGLASRRLRAGSPWIR